MALVVDGVETRRRGSGRRDISSFINTLFFLVQWPPRSPSKPPDMVMIGTEQVFGAVLVDWSCCKVVVWPGRSFGLKAICGAGAD